MPFRTNKEFSFGNFINRVVKFVASQYDSVIPDGGDAPGPYSLNDPTDAAFFADVNALVKEYSDSMDAVKLRLGLQTVMHISIRGNNYLQSSGLNKALMTANPIRCAQVVSRAINLIYVLSVLIYPFMPATSESILVQLNAPARAVPEMLAADILPGHQIGQPEHLFKKIEEKMAEKWRAQYGGPESVAPNSSEPVPTKHGASKRKAAVKPDPVPRTGSKSIDVLALEQKVAEVGGEIRALKGRTPKTKELDVEIATLVTGLKRLKSELAQLDQP
jgi:methionyl-tRNA synthetase